MASSDLDSKSVKPRDLRRTPSENVHIEFGDADEHDHSPRGDITACDIHLGAEGEHGELVIETVFARKEDERTIRQRIFEAWEYYHYYCIERVFIFPQPPDADDDEEDKEEYRLDCIRVRRNRYLLAALLMLLLALLFWLDQRGDSFAATPTPNASAATPTRNAFAARPTPNAFAATPAPEADAEGRDTMSEPPRRDPTLGLTCAFGAVVLFGSNYLPVKRFAVGDGFFFQWALCAGIWLVGMVLNAAQCLQPRGSSPPPFEPLAALGGAAWATGQLFVPFIVNSIGMAKGLIVWGATAMLSGYACGVFGWLGVRSQAGDVKSWPLNIAGLCLALASLFASLLLRPDTTTTISSAKTSGSSNGVSVSSLEQRLLPSLEAGSDGRESADANGRGSATSAHSDSTVGVVLALFAGLFFGTNFNGAQYVIDRAGSAAYPHSSSHGLDYVPSQFSGIFFASTLYFALYAVYMRNRPQINREVALPAVVSGLLWGVADALWFVANEQLGFVVAFPIVLSGPGVVASLWGIFVLGELRGTRNLVLAALVSTLVAGGAVLISLSRLA